MQTQNQPQFQYGDKYAVGYVRVSTSGQARSGLGLEAQRKAIEVFAKQEGFTINHWFTEAESGSGADALERRPQLAAALQVARKARAPVLVAKLDRLSRDVHFISGLMAHKVGFVACDLGTQSHAFVWILYAALAEKERSMISARTKAGLAAAKARGTKLGMSARSKSQVRKIAQSGADANKAVSLAKIETIRWAIESALSGDASLRKASELLNERGVASP